MRLALPPCFAHPFRDEPSPPVTPCPATHLHTQAWILIDNGTASGLLAACNQTVLDCNVPSDANRPPIYLDRTRPLDHPGISCGPAPSSRVLRIFHGPKCRLWREENAERCFWCETE